MEERVDSPKRDIAERTFRLAVRVVRMARVLKTDAATTALVRQVVRSGTSVGANVEEVQGAHSKRDFARRMNLARSEARETLFWLRVMAESGVVPPKRVADLVTETDEIVRILTAIVKRTKGA